MVDDGYAGFVKKVQDDLVLREKVLNARAKATVKVAAAAGFAISLDEARRELPVAPTDISDEQLEAIAGGLLDMPFAHPDYPPA